MLAAVAAGSSAMPAKLPSPSVGTAEQAGPEAPIMASSMSPMSPVDSSSMSPIGGIRTASMMCTVALAVGTSEQTTLASFTVVPSAPKVMVSPLTVSSSPAPARSAAFNDCPATTW